MKGKPKFDRIVNEAILEVVENQLRNGDPPETRQTYERLVKSGYSDEEARDLIGCVVVSELLDVVKNHRPYDHERYVAALKRLPTLPWE